MYSVPQTGSHSFTFIYLYLSIHASVGLLFNDQTHLLMCHHSQPCTLINHRSSSLFFLSSSALMLSQSSAEAMLRDLSIRSGLMTLTSLMDRSCPTPSTPDTVNLILVRANNFLFWGTIRKGLSCFTTLAAAQAIVKAKDFYRYTFYCNLFTPGH